MFDDSTTPDEGETRLFTAKLTPGEWRQFRRVAERLTTGRRIGETCNFTEALRRMLSAAEEESGLRDAVDTRDAAIVQLETALAKARARTFKPKTGPRPKGSIK